jgi:viologen exporter family transport system ATP-binding protein
VISAERLTKVFHSTVRQPGFRGTVRSVVMPQRAAKTAVDGVSLRAGPGELLALLGPNGAGKSTTIKMLTGILTPTSGRAVVNGIVPHQNRIANARLVGAVFGQRSQLWRDLPARESLEILRDIYRVPDREYRARLAEFDKILELTEFWDTRARQLSLGQRVRCDLAAALIHGPPAVFLDEPTIGMDVVVKEQVREFLRDQVSRHGRTVLLTTHDMTEVARLAGRVALIDHGRVVYDGPTTRLRDLVGMSWQVHVTLDSPGTGPAPAGTEVPGARVIRVDGDRVTFAPDGDPAMRPRDLVRRLIEHLPVIDISVEEPGLEDIVLAAFRTGQALAGADGGHAAAAVMNDHPGQR